MWFDSYWLVNDVSLIWVVMYFDVFGNGEVFVEWMIDKIVVSQNLVQIIMINKGDIIKIESFMFKLVDVFLDISD